MTGTAVRMPAHAKLNLFLRVLAREADGYHGLETLFCLVSLADELRAERRRGAAHREILLRRTRVRASHLDRDAAALAPLRAQLVGQVHEAEDRLHSMEPVHFPRQDPEEQVELRVRRHPDGGRRHGPGVPRRSLSATGVRARDQAPASVIGMNVAPW